MLKVLSIFGTRPEAIKMAPVIRELERQSERVVSRVCVTGQHRQMLDQVLQVFQIRPDYDLDLMEASQSPPQVAAAVLSRLEPILKTEKPDWVLVQGDTTTTMAASIAAFHARSRIGHIEAGLRTFNNGEPFPEEVNRRIVSVVADLHFAPTVRARDNLLLENVPPRTILITGNPVIDALLAATKKSSHITSGPVAKVPRKRRILLVTAHRRENFGQPLESICQALIELARRYRGDVHIVFPVHLNPAVREIVHPILAKVPGITLTDPLDYLSFVRLLCQSYLVLTDSGGLQEEAPSLCKPVLILRNTTERPEAVEAGTAKLVGTALERIVDEAASLLDDAALYRAMAKATNPYGDGSAANRIVGALLDDWNATAVHRFQDSGLSRTVWPGVRPR